MMIRWISALVIGCIAAGSCLCASISSLDIPRRTSDDDQFGRPYEEYQQRVRRWL